MELKKTGCDEVCVYELWYYRIQEVVHMYST